MKNKVTGEVESTGVEEVEEAYNSGVGEMSNQPNNDEQEDSGEKKVYICPYCGAKFDKSVDYARHIRLEHPDKVKGKKHSKRKEEEVEPPHPPEEEEIIKSPKEELEEWFIGKLEEELPPITGKDKAKIIIKTLRQSPSIIWDPQRLRYHIMQIAPRNINDYLLDWTLTGLYQELEEYRAKIERISGHPLPKINPPEPGPGYGYYGINPAGGYNTGYPMHTQEGYPHREPYPVYSPHERIPEQKSSVQDALLIKLVDKLLDKIDKKEKEAQKETLVEVPNPYGQGTIKVPASQVPTYLMIKSVQDQVNALKDAILKGQKNSGEQPKEPTVKIPTEEGTVELPASQAVYYLQVLHEREKRKEVTERLKKVEQQMLEMAKSSSPENLVKTMEQLGFRKYPSPTYDLLNKTRQDLNNMLDRILGMMEVQIRRQASANLPQLREQYESKYTPKEQKEKIKTIKQKIKKAENIAKLEKDIVDAVQAKE